MKKSRKKSTKTIDNIEYSLYNTNMRSRKNSTKYKIQILMLSMILLVT